VLADFVSADYVRWVREIVGPDHRLTVFASLACGPSSSHADIRQGMAGYMAGVVADGIPISLRMAPFFDELEARATETSWFEAVVAMPDEWFVEICPFGEPEFAAGYVEALAEAGADAVAFFPDPHDPLGDGEAAAELLLPLLG